MRRPKPLFAVAICAAAVPSPALAHWSDVIVDTPGKGGPACIALTNEATSETIGYLKMDRGDLGRDEIALIFANLSWSIEEGDDIGMLDLVHGASAARISPIAMKSALLFYMNPDAIADWVAENPGDTFALYRHGKLILRLPSEGFQEAVRAVRNCAGREFR